MIDGLDFFAQIPPSIDCVLEPQGGAGGIYLGNYTSANQLVLEQYNITTVVSALKSNPNEFIKGKPNIKNHLCVGIEDSSKQDITQHFSEVYDFIEKHRDTNVLIHCFSGISRSTALVLSYLMRKNKLGYETAFSEVCRKRNMVNPNEGFVTQLKNWYESGYQV